MKSLIFALACLMFPLGQNAYAGTVTYVYSDPQGTPLAEADANGNITATFDYQPYGTQALGGTPNGPSYTGHMNDPDSGLVYMQARYYDPVTARFLSVDPIAPVAGHVFNLNRYAYANNNPILNIDPTGMCVGPQNGDAPCNPEPIFPPVQPPKVSPAVQRMRDTSDCGGCIQPTSSIVGIPDPNSVPGGPWTPHNKPGQFQGPKPENGVGGRRRLQYVPPEGEGGPPGSKGYWKVNEHGQKGWQRYNLKGKPISPEAAHPGDRVLPTRLFRPAVDVGPVICFTCQIFLKEIQAQQDANQVPST